MSPLPSMEPTWSMWRPTISHVALCGAHVGVPFESGEYLFRGAAIDDPIEGGAPVRQPDVEPSDELQLVSSCDLLLGAHRRRRTKDCNDLTRLYHSWSFSTSSHRQRARRTLIPRQSLRADACRCITASGIRHARGMVAAGGQAIAARVCG